MRIVYALMASHADRERMVEENVLRAVELGRVDAVVFVNGGQHPFTIEQWENVFTVRHPWRDNFPLQRNQYLRKADELIQRWGDDAIICTADDDEIYSDDLWRDIRQIGEWALEHDKNQLAIRSHDITLSPQGQVIHRHISDYWKGLILVWEPDMYYYSTGPDRVTPSSDSFVHEMLYMPSGIRYARLDYSYEHRKTAGDVWLRAARNAWAGGGGPNLGESNPLWRPFQTLVRSHAPWVQTSMDFEQYLRQGVHPEVKDAMLSFRHLGTSHDARTFDWPEYPNGAGEWREIGLTYFVLFHPDELPREIIEADKEKIDWLGEIDRLHGLRVAG